MQSLATIEAEREKLRAQSAELELTIERAMRRLQILKREEAALVKAASILRLAASE